jgi:hypothetical protein
MRAFSCERCGQRLFFENSVCLRCGAAVGFRSSTLELVALEDHPELTPCSNLTLAECNWLIEPDGVDPDDDYPLCFSCNLTRTRPDDSDTQGMAEFAVAEGAKRRLIFQLLDIGLPIESDLSFDLLSSTAGPVTTGHDDGTVTIDLAESDDADREARRQQLAEPYRTMLGHFRHEIGHYYEPILVDRVPGQPEAARAQFGDERQDYAEAIDAHYQNGPPADWAERYVSAYATMHPWEDWAETWAHYLHIRDTLQTAAAFGIQVESDRPSLSAKPEEAVEALEAGQTGEPFSILLDQWLPLTYALNQVNRSMGKDDLYPFTLAPAVIDKLGFVHARVQSMTAGAQTP